MSGFPTGRVEAATDTVVTRVKPLAGGEVGRTWCADLDSGERVAVKTGPTPLDVEARSLRRLAETPLPVPAVRFADADVLVTEYVPGIDWTEAAERNLGRVVAGLHELTDDAYGWAEDTWKGRFRQANARGTDWPAFYADNRLRAVADAALDADGITPALRERVDALADDLERCLPADPPASLLHGDVWEANAIAGDGGVAALVDPSPWYGHAEVELAYGHWCGLGDAFRAGYEAVRDVEPEFEDRRPVYEIQFALDHAFHFPDEDYADWAAARLDALGF